MVKRRPRAQAKSAGQEHGQSADLRLNGQTFGSLADFSRSVKHGASNTERQTRSATERRSEPGLEGLQLRAKARQPVAQVSTSTHPERTTFKRPREASASNKIKQLPTKPNEKAPGSLWLPGASGSTNATSRIPKALVVQLDEFGLLGGQLVEDFQLVV